MNTTILKLSTEIDNTIQFYPIKITEREIKVIGQVKGRFKPLFVIGINLRDYIIERVERVYSFLYSMINNIVFIFYMKPFIDTRICNVKETYYKATEKGLVKIRRKLKKKDELNAIQIEINKNVI